MEELIANVISENMLSQLDSEGHHYQILKEISYHSVDRISIKRSNGFIISCSSNVHAKSKTIGWKLEVRWKDETLSWITLKNVLCK